MSAIALPLVTVQTFPLIASLGLTVLLVTLGVLVYYYMRSSKRLTYDDQLRDLLADENEEEPQTKVTPLGRWNAHWGKLFRGAGIARYGEDQGHAGRDATLIILAIFAISSILLSNPLTGLAITVVVTVAGTMVMRSLANRKSNALNYQLPGFISALKANIQASDTYERAMLKIVDSMPDPLHSDLVVVKNQLLTGSSFKEALEALSRKTSSRDLQFLTACLIQASESGAQMDGQLTNIQKVLEQRRKVSDEIARAVQSAAPAMVLASVIIPGLFLMTYIIDPGARAFWFVTPLSWAALAAILALYAGGMFMVKRLVDAIKNL